MAIETYYSTEEEKKQIRRKTILKNIGLYSFLIILSLFMIIPFYWMFLVSMWDAQTLLRSNVYGANILPIGLTFENFVEIFTNERYNRLFIYMIHTLINGFFSTILSIIVTIMAAFAFARLNFKGKEVLFAIFLATMMIPSEMFLITNFTTVATFGWLDTFTALIIPGLGSVFFMFFLRQTFRQIPNELYYAAKVDGNTDLNYLIKIMLPIAKPAIITITILSLIGSWNSFIWARTVNAEHRLITEGIMVLFQSDAADQTNMAMAAAVVVSVPLLIVFLVFKKYIMRGVSRAGIKG